MIETNAICMSTHAHRYTHLCRRSFSAKPGTVSRRVSLKLRYPVCMYMGRVTYVCTTCSEHFTRKYSAKRHNITVHHNNGGEIVTLVEYLVRRSSGKYQASDPSWYSRRNKEKRVHNFGDAAPVADTMGGAFRPGGLQRQQQGEYQYRQQSLEEQERYHLQAAGAITSSNTVITRQQSKTNLRMSYHIHLTEHFNLCL